MKRFGLIGNPVAGSLSPRLFAAAYDGRYPYDLIEGPDFEQSWQLFLDKYHGINVTAPFKQLAYGKVDILSETARLSGAVNLVVKTPEGLAGYNTDVDGVRLSLQEAGVQPQEALVLGAGGAGRAAAVAALQLGCRVTLINRTEARAQELAGRLGCAWRPFEDLSLVLNYATLLLYTLPVRIEALNQAGLFGHTVLEADYRHPTLTGIPGCRYVSGRRWLLHQAVAGYALFTGEPPKTEAMAEVL